ncbi:MAG: hypothetical protein CVT71_02675, partial [Alphaproteobacteria bacterium HGW-Alphaproteobacteria-10]
MSRRGAVRAERSCAGGAAGGVSRDHPGTGEGAVLTDPLDLDHRTGWPDDLLALLRRHPRDTWAGHANLGATATFWLRRHAMFRELGLSLAQATRALREEATPPEAFRRWFAPRLRFFLGELEGHHQIEDAHYFPVFQRAEPRLSRGFEVLERDHETIHADLIASADSGRALLDALARG